MLKAWAGAACGLVLASGSIAGPIFAFKVSNPSSRNTTAGKIESIASTYNTNSQVFVWNVTISNGVSKNTNGFWLVVGPGPNPKGHSYEYAIVYFGAASLADPVVSVYRYNGTNGDDSYKTPGDMLASTKTAGQTAITASASQSGDKRTFHLKIKAAAINAMFAPPPPQAIDWKGIQYGANIGLWFHTVAGLSPGYNASAHLTKFDFKFEGTFDRANRQTTIVPAPASLALLGLFGLSGRRRRR